jgi:HKD family nuclease
MGDSMADEFVLQGPWQPSAVLAALEALMSPTLNELRISVAYTTLSGCKELMPRLADRVEQWSSIPKTVITSTDFGFTEPEALRHLRDDLGIHVRLADIGGASFHTKVYAFGDDLGFRAFVGSANLTGAALITNGEAGAVVSFQADPQKLETAWAQLIENSNPLTDESLRNYEERRAKRPPPLPPETPVARRDGALATKDLSHFPDAVQAGALDPAAFEAMWVEAGSMSSSGSKSQLEIPRRGHRFFGFSFESYDGEQRTIGRTLLTASGRVWATQKLAWHGDNKMERFNLPTPAKHGFAYKGTAVLFRRLDDGFQLSVAPWDSDLAASWRAASREQKQEYRLGRNSPRTCGLF